MMVDLLGRLRQAGDLIRGSSFIFYLLAVVLLYKSDPYCSRIGSNCRPEISFAYLLTVSPRKHLALQHHTPSFLHFDGLLHGKQRLLDLVPCNAGIKPALVKGSPCCSWPVARQANHFRAFSPANTLVPALT
jgi:hypothetical protein